MLIKLTPIKIPKKIASKIGKLTWTNKPLLELVIEFKKKIKINKGIVIKKVTISDEIVWPVLVLINTAITKAMLVNKTKKAIVIKITKTSCQIKIELIIVVLWKANNKIITTKKINKSEIIIKIKLNNDVIIKKLIFFILVKPILRKMIDCLKSSRIAKKLCKANDDDWINHKIKIVIIPFAWERILL